MCLKHHGDGEAIVTEILQRWLEGKGVPLKWENLIRTLNDMQHCFVASEVEQHVYR